MRLIDADELIADLENGLWDWDSVNGITAATVLRQTISDIKNAPTIDAVPVVRCKDCRWYGTYQLTKYGEYDKRYKPTVCIKGEYSIMRNEDWYCANGERKGEDETD